MHVFHGNPAHDRSNAVLQGAVALHTASRMSQWDFNSNEHAQEAHILDGLV